MAGGISFPMQNIETAGWRWQEAMAARTSRLISRRVADRSRKQTYSIQGMVTMTRSPWPRA